MNQKITSNGRTEAHGITIIGVLENQTISGVTKFISIMKVICGTYAQLLDAVFSSVQSFLGKSRLFLECKRPYIAVEENSMKLTDIKSQNFKRKC